MKFLGSRTIETSRLILKSQTMNEQERLWEILMMPNVNRYYLKVPVKFRDKLKDWNKQKSFYEEDMKHANDNNVFRWSIFLKDTGECIGRISCHEAHAEDENINDSNIRGVGWIIDPNFQGKGYGTEAAKAMIEFMFLECEIEQIITGAAICNPASWRIMEKLGFERQEKTKMIQYTFIDDLTEDYVYIMAKERYLSLNSAVTRRQKMRLTRRFIVKSLENIPLSNPIRYERYYINDKLRIQKKGDCYEKEILDDENVITQKCTISEEEFISLKASSYSKIIRDSYLYLEDNRISIKKYYDEYEGLNRVEVEFSSMGEMNKYKKEPWMGSEITASPLAFDKYLSKLEKEEFLLEIQKYL